ncbi:MAG: hypothetical protein KA354_00700 [Phycisphaerae bacterium]|nr:hypothetical protein [Phycisphaerae bacterium]
MTTPPRIRDGSAHAPVGFGRCPPGRFAHVGEPLVGVLAAYGIGIEMCSARMVLFTDVPTNERFNKGATNVLVLGQAACGGAIVMVDDDLEYRGGDAPGLADLLRRGPCRRRWRRLDLDPVPGDRVLDVLLEVLELFGSSCLAGVREAVERETAASPAEDESPTGRVLARAEVITKEDAAAAEQRCIRPYQAEQLAMIAARPEPPHAAIVIGVAGAGKDTVMVAAANQLMERRVVRRVFRIEAAVVAAGAMFETDRDAALMTMLTEMQEQVGSLFLVKGIDLLLGTPISHALLAAGLDRGLRLFGTLKAPSVSLRRIAADSALRRRLVLTPLETPVGDALARALDSHASASGVEVEPAARRMVLRLSAQHGQAQPGAAASLLAAAIAATTWRGGTVVTPDDVAAADSLEAGVDFDELME